MLNCIILLFVAQNHWESEELEDVELVLILDLNLVNNIARFQFASLTAIIHQRPNAYAFASKIQICILFLLILFLYLENPQMYGEPYIERKPFTVKPIKRP